MLCISKRTVRVIKKKAFTTSTRKNRAKQLSNDNVTGSWKSQHFCTSW